MKKNFICLILLLSDISVFSSEKGYDLYKDSHNYFTFYGKLAEKRYKRLQDFKKHADNESLKIPVEAYSYDDWNKIKGLNHIVDEDNDCLLNYLKNRKNKNNKNKILNYECDKILQNKKTDIEKYYLGGIILGFVIMVNIPIQRASNSSCDI